MALTALRSKKRLPAFNSLEGHDGFYNRQQKAGSMSTITIGVDLAKNVFSVCAVDGAGHVQQLHDPGREGSRYGWGRCSGHSGGDGSLSSNIRMHSLDSQPNCGAQQGSACRFTVPSQSTRCARDSACQTRASRSVCALQYSLRGPAVGHDQDRRAT